MAKRSFFVCLEAVEASRLTAFMNKMAMKGNNRAKLRAKAVWLSHRFRNVNQIAEELGCSIRSVYTWLRRYRAKGITGISEPDKATKLTREQVNQMLETSQWMVASRSKKYIRPWTYQKMVDWVREQWHITISAERIRQIVNKEFGGDL
jgi:transposase